VGEQNEVMKLRRIRFNILRQWYSDIRDEEDWAHKICLSALGLDPLPGADTPLDQIIGSKTACRISMIVDNHLEAPLGPLQLIQLVWLSLMNEFSVPSREEHRQFRYVLSHWIITRHVASTDGKGSIKPSMDFAFFRSSDIEPIRNIDISCRISDWMIAPMADQEFVEREHTIGGLPVSCLQNIDRELLTQILDHQTYCQYLKIEEKRLAVDLELARADRVRVELDFLRTQEKVRGREENTN
jgi:hypothetical protein